MRFSVVQQKKLLKLASGKFVGYIIDAEVDEQSGKIVSFLVSEPKKFLSFLQGEDSVRKVLINDILVIGKDVILVKSLYE